MSADPDAERRRIFEECAALATEELNIDAEPLDTADAIDIVGFMNREDRSVAPAVEKVLPRVAEAVDRITRVLRAGGRLFYIGAGTSVRSRM